jgi:hypothetical protein
MTEPTAVVEARLGPTPLRGWTRRLLHLAALAVGWGLFFWAWNDVLGQHWETEFLMWLVAGSVVILPLVTTAWILHNVKIFRRKGPRMASRKVEETYLHDWNGREISADFAALARAAVVVIDVEGKRKVYRGGGVLPLVPWTVTQTPLHHAAVDAAPSRGATEVTARRVA